MSLTLIRARFKRATSGTLWLVLCGKPDARGNRTCPGTFAVAMGGNWGGAGPALIRMYGILRPDNRSVYRLSPRNMDRLAEGRTPTLRRPRVHDPTIPPDDHYPGSWLDYGTQGERAGELIYTFPVLAACPRCQTVNEILPPTQERP